MDSAELTTTIDMAMLELEPADSALLQDAVTRMLEFFKVMSAIDVDGIEPTTHAFTAGNQTRPDVRAERSLADELLENAPDLENRFIPVPNVL